MVRITEELVRKKSEHNECMITTLEELSLHQEDVEKIEHLQNWCRDLQILYLQANLISKIENLNKLKQLQYLNLAINNIEKIENLERCESLEKLDLTLNFVGDLESACSLKDNMFLKHLFLTGNPCSDYPNYRNYVIAQLPQLETLDNVEITRSERIKAQQILHRIETQIKQAQQNYFRSRQEQKNRMKSIDPDLDDETFWKSSSEHSPETRVEIARRARLSRRKDEDKPEPKVEKPVAMFSKDGRPLNINRAKMRFTFDDSHPEVMKLNVEVYKHLDSTYIEVDLQPIFVRVLIKGKVFQYVFPEEILVHKSTAERSQASGHLLLTLYRVNHKPIPIHKEEKVTRKSGRNNLLEVSQKSKIDYANILANSKRKQDDNSEVPPLEYA